jgi:hypothetical protein
MLVNIKLRGGKVMRAFFLAFTLVFLANPSWAKEIEGVVIEEQLVSESGVTLQLNGAAVRKKLFFKIYIAALYLANPSAEASSVIADEGEKRIVMHFLYDEVGKDKLVEGWDEGFAANHSAEALGLLQPRIDTFNAMFDEDMVAGDVIVFDYLPDTGTRVTIKGNVKGVIEGKDFNDALLAIWLGEKPVGSDLKKGLLKL